VQDDLVFYIGKEANNIDEQALEVDKVQLFVNKEEIMWTTLDISQKEAEATGVSRNVPQEIKKRIRGDGGVNFDTLGLRRLIEKPEKI
jgi:hypothetical protein